MKRQLPGSEPLDPTELNAYIARHPIPLRATGPRSWEADLYTGGVAVPATLFSPVDGEFCAQALIVNLSEIEQPAKIENSLKETLRELGRQVSTAAVVLQGDDLLVKSDSRNVRSPQAALALVNDIADAYPPKPPLLRGHRPHLMT